MKKILDELPILLEKGLIDEATRARLVDFYGQRQEEKSLFGILKSFALYLIGAIFVVISAYMFIDYNWSVFSDSFKAILMFLPLLVSFPFMAYALKRPSVLSECIALTINFSGLMLALLAPSVIYNASGSQLDFVTALVFLFVPLVIIFRQPLALVLGAILMISLKVVVVDFKGDSLNTFATFGYLLFFVILLWQLLDVKERLSYEFFAKIFATFLLGISFVIAPYQNLSEYTYMVAFGLASFAIYKEREVLFVLAMSFFVWLTCMTSSYSGFSRRSGVDCIVQDDLFLSIAAISMIVFGLISIGLAIYKKRSFFSISIACYLFVHLVIFVSLPSFKGTEGFDLAVWTKGLCNVSAISIFALLYARGFEKKSLVFLNEAFAVIILYALMKLGDRNWTLVEHSALFLAIGVVMIFSNKFLNRKVA